MAFVELDRKFVALGKGQEPSVDIGRFWGGLYGGWISWDELKKYRRVVLLAEASSGKSAEFRAQADALTAKGKSAFLVRIEELVDQGFEDSLDPGAAKAFQAWLKSADDGWFFLDSVDEARLNHKNFETALKRFARALDQTLDRANIVISCRITDWKGDKDRLAISQYLPAHMPAKKPDESSNPLLDPIFKAKAANTIEQIVEPEPKVYELQIVQLAPLLDEQCRKLASASGINDSEAFFEGVQRHGLDAFAERPGDILDLVDFWKQFGKFDTLEKMTEYAISLKLREIDTQRPDNNILSSEKAREGGERIAGALTFGKSFTLRVPSYDPDPSLSSGAINPVTALPDWNDAEREALARRAVFAPATYGRVRFHHRSTQEYLAASWLNTLLKRGCPKALVWDLIFSERYGVKTVVPSLRPVGAWLSLWYEDIRREVISREPLTLLRTGDPGAMPLAVREELLLTFAVKHAAGEISDDSVDHRALWMFADPKLSNAIRKAWDINQRTDFRVDLLRLIREGKLCDCIDLAKAVAIDPKANDYARIVAVQIVKQCNDTETLKILAALLLTESTMAPRVKGAVAECVFPTYLTVADLLKSIAATPFSRPDRVEGFLSILVGLYQACPSRAEQAAFVAGLAKLCAEPPYVESYQKISKHYIELSKGLEPIAEEEVRKIGDNAPEDFQIHLLYVLERVDDRYNSERRIDAISKAVRASRKINRALFWADVADQRDENGPERPVTFHWQVFFYGSRLWALTLDDLPWLEADLDTKENTDDKRVAFSAIVALIKESGKLEERMEWLKSKASKLEALTKDLEWLLKPPTEDESSRKHRLRMETHNERRKKKEDDAKKSWENFSKTLQADPEQLREPEKVKSWETGAWRLSDATRWLQARVGENRQNAAREWRLLTEGFNQTIAEAYRDGMKIVWRKVPPERPLRKEGSAITTKFTTLLAFDGVGVEAAEDPAWADKLSEQEVRLAAEHGCYSEQGYPEWIDDLIAKYPNIVVPIVKGQIQFEWDATFEGVSNFLYRYRAATTPLTPALESALFEVIAGTAPTTVHKFSIGLRILRRLRLSRAQKSKLQRVGLTRMVRHTDAGEREWALQYLSMLTAIDIDRNIQELERCVKSDTRGDVGAESILAMLFDRHDPILVGVADTASVATLERLLTLAFEHVKIEADHVHEGGSYTPDARDNAESARSSILSMLLERRGPEAFYALKRASEHPAFALRADRFKELVHGKAEKDTEFPPWTEPEVAAFNSTYMAPAKTGADLLRIVMGVLSDIQHDLTKGDVSSRRLLEHAKDEEDVQNWIAEQMNLRSNGRFRVHREKQVALRDKPDITVTSTSASCEVGIEVKHGNKGWSGQQLDNALRTQLAEDYLKPEYRRHGIFIVTKHGPRQWEHPKTGTKIEFETLIEYLGAVAEMLVGNTSGPIQVECFGINASPPKGGAK